MNEPLGITNAQRAPHRGSHERARATLEKLLATIEDGKLTGESYLRISANQGGVTRVRFAIESEDK